ncbi:MAG: hypothetical protein AVDCRST_MAG30-73, partial [uncultured Solirubrobacteraceae bacterium]
VSGEEVPSAQPPPGHRNGRSSRGCLCYAGLGRHAVDQDDGQEGAPAGRGRRRALPEGACSREQQDRRRRSTGHHRRYRRYRRYRRDRRPGCPRGPGRQGRQGRRRDERPRRCQGRHGRRR